VFHNISIINPTGYGRAGQSRSGEQLPESATVRWIKGKGFKQNAIADTACNFRLAVGHPIGDSGIR
jgi:hypothetical protein